MFLKKLVKCKDEFRDRRCICSSDHKVLTYTENRTVSGFFRTIDTPTPSPPSECVLPPHQRRGVHNRRAVMGWGVNISEDVRHWIGLLQYSIIPIRVWRTTATVNVRDVRSSLPSFSPPKMYRIGNNPKIYVSQTWPANEFISIHFNTLFFSEFSAFRVQKFG